jgi:hypothetical protein
MPVVVRQNRWFTGGYLLLARVSVVSGGFFVYGSPPAPTPYGPHQSGDGTSVRIAFITVPLLLTAAALGAMVGPAWRAA